MDLHPACSRTILRGLQRKNADDNSQVSEAQSVKRALAIGGRLRATPKHDDDDYFDNY